MPDPRRRQRCSTRSPIDFLHRASVSRRTRSGPRARRRSRRRTARAARARNPVRAGPRSQSRHAGLSDRPHLTRCEGRLRRRRDPARHSRRPVDLDEEDLHGRARGEGAGDRLRLARRSARGVCRCLDRASGRRARDGADDEHRLVDADRLERAEPRLRSETQGDQRLRGVAHRARCDAQAQHDLAGARRAQGVEPHRPGSAAHERGRPDRAQPAGAARQARRLPHEGPATSVHAASRGRAHRLREPGLPHAVAEHAHRPEPAEPPLSRRHRRDRLRDLPSGRRAARRARRHLAADRPLRLLGPADLVVRARAHPARRRPARDRRARRLPRSADAHRA